MRIIAAAIIAGVFIARTRIAAGCEDIGARGRHLEIPEIAPGPVAPVSRRRCQDLRATSCQRTRWRRSVRSDAAVIDQRTGDYRSALMKHFVRFLKRPGKNDTVFILDRRA